MKVFGYNINLWLLQEAAINSQRLMLEFTSLKLLNIYNLKHIQLSIAIHFFHSFLGPINLITVTRFSFEMKNCRKLALTPYNKQFIIAYSVTTVGMCCV